MTRNTNAHICADQGRLRNARYSPAARAVQFNDTGFVDDLQEQVLQAVKTPLINLAPFAISVIRIDFELTADGVANLSTHAYCFRYPVFGYRLFSRRPGACSNTLAATTLRRIR